MTRRVLLVLALGVAVGFELALGRSAAPASASAPVATQARVVPVQDSGSSLVAGQISLDAGALPPLASGFCPSPGEDPAPYPRPQLADYLNAQSRASLAAFQARISHGGSMSPELREAIAGVGQAAPDEGLIDAIERAPDRQAAGVDLAARLILRLAMGKVATDPEAAQRLAERAAADAPTDAFAYALSAFAAEQRGDTAAAREALRHARSLAPAEPALLWALVRSLEQTVYVDELRDVLTAYVERVPQDLAARQLLARVGVQCDIQQGYIWRTSSGITLAAQSDLFTEQTSQDLLDAVAADLDEAAQVTGTPRRRELTVIVYPGHEELLAVSCVNAWSGALYDGVLRVVGDAHQGNPVARAQLKHEVMHAQLTPVAPNAPFWFNEGLATHFGEPGRSDLVNAERQFVANRTCFPFSSLQGSFQPFRDPADATRAYAQSLAMVDFLIDRGGSDAIPDLIEALRRGVAPASLLDAAMGRPVTTDDLLDYLQQTLPAAPR